MTEPWLPPLSLHERDGRCRLTLAGVAYGDGATLQEAADDLIARVGEIATRIRTCGLGCSTDLPPPDHAILAFIWEVGERLAAGQDIRDRIFGAVT